MEIDFKLLKAQRALYESKKPIAGIYSGRGIGKTFIISFLIMVALLRGEKVLAFSQTYKSLSQNLFQEVVKRFEQVGQKPDYNRQAMTISFNGAVCYGYSYENVESCRGLTDCRWLILDEIALAPTDIMAIAGPCCRGDFTPMIRFCSTPRKGSYWDKWVKSGMADGSIDVFTGKMSDNTFLSQESIDLAMSAITDENMRRQELYGEILEDSDDSCIVNPGDFALSLIDNSYNYPLIVGIDGSGMGRDKSVMCLRKGNKIIAIRKYDSLTGVKAESELRRILMDNWLTVDDVYEINIDMGYGQAIYEEMSKYYGNVNIVPFASKANNASYGNKRAEMYFNLAKAVRAGLFIDDDSIKEELLNTRFILDHSDRYLIIPKEEIKEVIGRSPDISDALALTFCNEYNVFTRNMSRSEKKHYAYNTMGNPED